MGAKRHEVQKSRSPEVADFNEGNANMLHYRHRNIVSKKISLPIQSVCFGDENKSHQAAYNKKYQPKPIPGDASH